MKDLKLHHLCLGNLDVSIAAQCGKNMFLIEQSISAVKGVVWTGLVMQLSDTQNVYFRTADKRFYDCLYPHKSNRPLSLRECQGFVPDIWYDKQGDGYLLLVAPSPIVSKEQLVAVAKMLADVDACIGKRKQAVDLSECTICMLIAGYELVKRI